MGNVPVNAPRFVRYWAQDGLPEMWRIRIAVALLRVALAAAAVVSVACGEDEEATPSEPTPGQSAVRTVSPSAQPTETEIATPSPLPTVTEDPVAGGRIWRWWNVTLTIRDGSGFGFGASTLPAADNPPNGGPAVELTLKTGGDGSNLWLDAETGEMLDDNVLNRDRAAFDVVLATISVGPLDDAALSLWPYSEDTSTAGEGFRAVHLPATFARHRSLRIRRNRGWAGWTNIHWPQKLSIKR